MLHFFILQDDDDDADPSPSNQPSVTEAENADNKPMIGDFIQTFMPDKDSNTTTVGAFHLGLKADISLDPKESVTLKNFDVSGRDDLFISNGNSGFNPINGTFRPEDDGVFLLTTHVHLTKSALDADIFPLVKVLICLNEECSLM